MIKEVILAATIALGGVQASVPRETVVIDTNWGGSIVEHYEKYSEYKRRNSLLVVDGVCISACTMISGVVPRENICVTERAIFGYHSAFVMTTEGPKYSEMGTKLLWMILPEFVREKVRAAGWDGPSEHPSLVFVQGTELYPLCGGRNAE